MEISKGFTTIPNPKRRGAMREPVLVLGLRALDAVRPLARLVHILGGVAGDVRPRGRGQAERGLL